MSNQAFNLMSAAYYDQLCEQNTPAMLVGGFDPDFFRGSFNNPLQTLRLITLDIEEEGDFGCERLSEATGVPAKWFSDTRLNAPADEVIRALGVMTLIYLSSIRNTVMKEGFKVQASEDSLAAETTFREGLDINRRLAA